MSGVKYISSISFGHLHPHPVWRDGRCLGKINEIMIKEFEMIRCSCKLVDKPRWYIVNKHHHHASCSLCGVLQKHLLLCPCHGAHQVAGRPIPVQSCGGHTRACTRSHARAVVHTRSCTRGHVFSAPASRDQRHSTHTAVHTWPSKQHHRGLWHGAHLAQAVHAITARS